MGFAPLFNQRFAIDPGSAVVRLAAEAGPVIQEPCLVSLSVRRPPPGRRRRAAVPAEQVRLLAVGSAVEPPPLGDEDTVRIVRPVARGRIADVEALDWVLRRLYRRAPIGYLRKTVLGVRMLLVGSPHLTEQEEAGFRELLRDYGFSRVPIVSAPLAAALGAGIDPERSLGQMVIDIGAGHTTVATFTLGSIAAWHWAPTGGYDLDQAVAEHLQRRHRIRVHPLVAEAVKCRLGSVYPLSKPASLDVVGFDPATGVEKKVALDDNDLRDVLIDGCEPLVLAIHQSFEGVPPELAADIAQGEITLVGGGALLAGLPEFLAERTGLRFRVAPDPVDVAIRGALLVP